MILGVPDSLLLSKHELEQKSTYRLLNIFHMLRNRSAWYLHPKNEEEAITLEQIMKKKVLVKSILDRRPHVERTHHNCHTKRIHHHG